MNISSPEYYRNSKNWQKLIGKYGVVELETQIKVSTPELEDFLPYSFLIVNLDNGEKIEIMGEARSLLSQGDKIRLELRKIAQPDLVSIIPYGLKAVKIN
jgi:uncharacterized OB-fold protein